MKKMIIGFLRLFLFSAMMFANIHAVGQILEKTYVDMYDVDGITFMLYKNYSSSYLDVTKSFTGNCAMVYNIDSRNVRIPGYVTYNGEEYKVVSLRYGTIYDELIVPNTIELIEGSLTPDRGYPPTKIIFEDGENDLFIFPDGGNPMFRHFSKLKEIYLGRNIHYLGEDDKGSRYHPFAENEAMDIKVTVGRMVTDIPNYCFMMKYSTAVSNIDFSGAEHLTTIGEYAFYTSSRITSLNIIETVTEIGNYAFNQCYNLTDITVAWTEPLAIDASVFPSHFNYHPALHIPFGSLAAYQNTNVWKNFDVTPTAISFADTETAQICLSHWDTDGNGKLIETEVWAVTNLGNVFKSNAKITSFRELEYFTNLSSISDDEFSGCISLESITIPDNVASIGNNAFLNCSSLKSVAIPAKVSSIGNYAFGSCTSLTSVTVGWTTPLTVDESLFDSVNIRQCSLKVPSGTHAAYHSAPVWKYFNIIADIIKFADPLVEKICVSNKLDDDGDKAISEAEAAKLKSLGTIFKNKMITSFNELKYFRGLTSITSSAFSGCTALKSITIPGSVESIAKSKLNAAFKNCKSLTDITVEWTTPIPVDGTVFTGMTVSNCSLHVPYGTSKAYQTADVWKNFKIKSEINFADAATKEACLKKWDADRDGGLSEIEVLEINSLGTAFMNNKNMTSFDELKYFTNLKDIGAAAFYGCSSLTSITIPDSVSSIGNMAFSGCTSLDSISIPNSVTEIGQQAFYNCKSLKWAEISSGVVKVGKYAYYNCCSLQSVIFKSLPSVGTWAFYGCDNLSNSLLDITDSEQPFIATALMNYPILFTQANYHRRIEGGAWETIVLPFVPDSMGSSQVELPEFYTLEKMMESEDGTSILLAKKAKTIKAGVPYLLRNESSNPIDFTLTSRNPMLFLTAKSQPADGFTLNGSLQQIQIDGVENGNLYYMEACRFCRATGETIIAPFRAYLECNDSKADSLMIISEGSQSFPAEVNDEATGIETMHNAQCKMHNGSRSNVQGQSLIYNLNGIRGGANNRIIIIEGKKYLMK